MKHTTRFSLTDAEYISLTKQAHAKGMTLSALAKMSLFAYVTRYPAKVGFSQADIERIQQGHINAPG